MNRVYVVAGAILVVLAGMSLFTVDERERAILRQLGEIKRTDIGPGIHWKWFWQDVIKFDGRIQTLDTSPQLYLTSEKKQVIVDSFVKWRIRDVARFYTSTGGSSRQTNDRLAPVVLKRLRDEFGKRTVQQVVAGQRADIMSELTNSFVKEASELGVEIIDVRIKRVDLPENVSQSVYDRMAAERKQVAKKFRSEGEEQARRIRAGADREREVIVAEAEREAQKVRGDGDRVSTRVYAEAYQQDPEFYALYRTLDAYQNTFRSSSDVLLIEPNTRFFRYFNDPRPPEAASE